MIHRLNHSITLEEFKRIFFWEWSHRFLGRFVGMVFVLPLAYFIVRKKISKNLAWKLSGLSALFAAQGLMGWYMVKSGLDEQLLETPGAVPRVSQYRLAAHLGLAFILYVAMFSTGLATIKDYKFATSGLWNGQTLKDFQKVLQSPLSRKLLMQSRILFGMVFLTAMSGKNIHPVCLQYTSRVFRCLCGGPRCWIAVQRVPADGWTPSASFG